jgi:SAM-dependent methyltransferase
MPICPLLGCAQTEAYGEAFDYLTGDRFALGRCQSCGIVFTDPAPTDLDRHYPPRYRKYRGIVELPLGALYRRRARRWARAFARPGRALEIGCGQGAMLDELRRAGWGVLGVERAGARADGLPVVAATLDQVGPDEGFDLVILFQTLEHLPHPLAALRQCRRLLAPGGRLVVSVPNHASWQARWFGGEWFHLDVPRHLFHFTPGSLRACLDRAGFTIERLHHVNLEQDNFWVGAEPIQPVRPTPEPAHPPAHADRSSPADWARRARVGGAARPARHAYCAFELAARRRGDDRGRGFAGA